MDIDTHQEASERYVGTPVSVDDGRAVVELDVVDEMRVDERGLAHGGFVFGAADYAAMLAVNEPTVVLAGADVGFRAPVAVGDTVRATASVVDADDSRVDCTVTVGDREVLTGTFDCAVLDTHVLD
jgi:acyl-coenzyme A thioesterase PaaI-like protein